MQKRQPVYYVILAITGIAIIVSSIFTKQLFIKTLPCIISLFVQLLTAKANRWTYLLGGINCIIYSIGYYLENLLGSLFQAFLISMPIQISAFILWGKRNKNRQQVKLKSINKKQLVILLLSLVVTYPLCIILFKLMNSSNIYLDTAIFVFGVYASVLSMLGYVQSQLIEFIKFAICVCLWTVKCFTNIVSITYLIFNIFATIMTYIGYINWHNIYKQEEEKNNG